MQSLGIDGHFIRNPIGVFGMAFVKPSGAFVGGVGVPADGAAAVFLCNFA